MENSTLRLSYAAMADIKEDTKRVLTDYPSAGGTPQ